jgi:hypothetical protein
MKKVIKLSESQLYEVIKKTLQEERTENYMFFSNLEQIKRQAELLLDLPKEVVEGFLQNGHDWADDHISKSKENLDHVFEFMMNEVHSDDSEFQNNPQISTLEEGRKKTGTKLCARGKSAAKAKFDVYPSAYANGYAVQVCKGKMPGLDGKKHCSGAYC